MWVCSLCAQPGYQILEWTVRVGRPLFLSAAGRVMVAARLRERYVPDGLRQHGLNGWLVGEPASYYCLGEF